MPTLQKPQLHLSEEIREGVEKAITLRIQAAVAGAKDRDGLICDYRDQMEGLLSDSNNAPWDNACDLDDPLSREAFLTIKAQFLEVLRREPKVYADAVDVSNKDNAENQQEFLTHKARQVNLDVTLLSIADYCMYEPVGILYHGWTERVRWEKKTLYKKDGELFEDTETDDSQAYEEVHVIDPEHIEYAGLEDRAVDTLDFYLYPSTAKSIEQAQGCGERLRLSADDLLNGINDFGFEEEAVEKLIARGPTHHISSDDYEERLSDKGLTPSEIDLDGYYECFLWFHRLPQLRDGNGKLLFDDALLHEEYMSVACPDAQVILCMDFSPYGRKRPYIPFYVDRDPSSFYGRCPMEWLNALQSEANANLRYTINCMNLEMTPVLRVQKRLMKELQTISYQPGVMMPFEQTPEEISPLEMTQTARDGLGLQQFIDNKAMGLYSSQGLQLQPKVRKTGEVQAAQQQAASKFALMWFEFQQSLVEWAVRTISLAAEHIADDGEEWMDALDHVHTVTPDMLKGEYIYRAATTAQMATQEARVETMMAVMRVASEYLLLKSSGKIPPDDLRLHWNMRHRVIQELGVHQPEEYIGEDPAKMPQPQLPMGPPTLQGMQMPMMPQVAQGATNGNGSRPPDLTLAGTPG